MTIRQFKMLSEELRKPASVEAVMQLNQTTFGSLCYQKWVEFDVDKKAFVISKRGQQIFSLMRNVNLHRENESAPLSKYVRYRKNIIQIRRMAS